MAKFVVSHNGASYQVTTGDDFLQLPQDEQARQLGASFDQMDQGRSSTPASPSSQQSAPAAPSDDGGVNVADIGQGIHNTLEGIGSTIGLAAPQTGAAISGAVGAAQGAHQTNIGQRLRSGDFSGALGQIPAAVVQGLPDMAGTVAAGRVGAGIGGAAGSLFPGVGTGVGAVVGGALGAGAYGVARYLGDNSNAVAKNNNHATPTAGDIAQGAAATIPQAALGAIGVGRFPGVSSTLEGLSPLVRPVADVALEGGAAAAGDATQQLGTSVGTTKGAQFDPYQSLGAGVQGAATRAAMLAPKVGADIIGGATNAYANSRVSLPSDPEQLQSISRVSDMIDTAQQNAPTKVDFNAAANSIKTELTTRGKGYLQDLKDTGIIDNLQYRQGVNLLDNQALRSNNTITSSDADQPPSLLDQVKAWDLPPEVTQPLTQTAVDLNTISGQSFKNRNTGPFRQLASTIGTGAGVVGGLMTGHPMAAAGALLLNHGTAPIYGAIGGVADRMFGTDQPNVVRQAAKANSLLARQGLTSGDNTLGMVDNARLALAGVQDQQTKAASSLGTQADLTKESNAQSDADFQSQQQMVSDSAKAEALKQVQMAQIQAQAGKQNQQSQANTDAAFKPVDQANASTQDQIDAYMNGKGAASPPDPTVGLTYAQELAIQNQRMANAVSRAKFLQKQSDQFNKAGVSDVDSLAQAKLDKSTRSNQIDLTAAEKIPSPNTSDTDTAATAAVVKAVQAARQIQGLAGANQDVGDSITVGNPVSQTTPINPAPRSPPGAPQAPAAPSTAAPSPTPPAAQIPASVGIPGQAPVGPSVGIPTSHAELLPMHPWQNFVANGDRTVTGAHIASAIDAAVGSGTLDPRHAALLQTHTGSIHPEIAAPIQEALAAIHGQPGDSPGASVGVPETGYRGPIIDPEKYANATAQYRQHADDKIAMAAGDQGLQAALTNIRDEPSEAGKQAIAAKHVASLAASIKGGNKSAVARLVHAKSLLTGPLMKSKVK